MHARPAYEVPLKTEGVTCHVLNWFNTAFLFKSRAKEPLLDAALTVIKAWRTYSDPTLDILAQTEEPHNTATTLMRLEEGEFFLYVILRNNRRSKRYPEGIFHAHPEYHHIKSEGIGLIEAGGLFILPARLKRQLMLIEEELKDDYKPAQIVERHPELAPHQPMIQFIYNNREDDLRKEVTTFVNRTCQAILIDTAVFKHDANGQAGLTRFIKEALG